MQKTKVGQREVGIQSIVPPKFYMTPKVLAAKPLEKSEFHKFFYKAHTFSILGVGYLVIIAIFLFSFFKNN